MRKLSKRTTIVAASAATVMTASGIAYAWYAAGVAGTGTGSATPGATVSDVTFAASAITDLYPGASKVVTVTPTNPNAFSVHIAQHSVSVTNAEGGACSNAEAQLSGTGTMAAQTIAANSAGTPFNITVAMADDASMDQTDCAGTPLTVTYTAS